MTPAEVRADYRREIAEHGETITLRRVGMPNVDVSAKAFISNYRPEELVGNVQEGSRRAIVLAEDVTVGGFPLPFIERLDEVEVRGTTLRIMSVGERVVAGEVIAYELQIRGD